MGIRDQPLQRRGFIGKYPDCASAVTGHGFKEMIHRRGYSQDSQSHAPVRGAGQLDADFELVEGSNFCPRSRRVEKHAPDVLRLGLDDDLVERSQQIGARRRPVHSNAKEAAVLGHGDCKLVRHPAHDKRVRRRDNKDV
jgi:hypothetical protein